jgi:hypothetical protein
VPSALRAAAEVAAAEAQQEHRELAALGAERAETGEHRHLAVVDDARTARGHPGPADPARDLGAALDQAQDLGVQAVDLEAQFGDLGLGRDVVGRPGP